MNDQDNAMHEAVTLHLTASEIRQYRERRLTGTSLLAADSHLSTCPSCRACLLGSRDRRELMHTLVESLEDDELHLGFEEMAAHVDQVSTLGDRRATDEHLSWCHSCREEVDELRKLAEALPGRARLELVSSTPVQRRNVRPRWLAAAAGIGALVLGGWWIASRDSHRVTPQQIAVVAAPPQLAALIVHDAATTIRVEKNGLIDGITAADSNDAEMLRQVLAGGAVPRADLNQLAPANSTLMGQATMGQAPSAAFALTSPLGTLVRSTRPDFTWQPMSAGTTYRVEVYTTSFDRIATSPELTTTSWTCDVALHRGERYRWQVVARNGSDTVSAPQPPATEALFSVLNEDTAKQLDASDTQYRDSHLMRALTYSRAGLRDDARDEAMTLAKLNPGSTDVAAIVTRLTSH